MNILLLFKLTLGAMTFVLIFTAFELSPKILSPFNLILDSIINIKNRLSYSWLKYTSYSIRSISS